MAYYILLYTRPYTLRDDRPPVSSDIQHRMFVQSHARETGGLSERKKFLNRFRERGASSSARYELLYTLS